MIGRSRWPGWRAVRERGAPAPLSFRRCRRPEHPSAHEVDMLRAGARDAGLVRRAQAATPPIRAPRPVSRLQDERRRDASMTFSDVYSDLAVFLQTETPFAIQQHVHVRHVSALLTQATRVLYCTVKKPAGDRMALGSDRMLVDVVVLSDKCIWPKLAAGPPRGAY